MFPGDPIVVYDHLLHHSLFLQQSAHLVQGAISDKAVEFNHTKAFRFDFGIIDRLGVDDNETAEVNRFQESVAESFDIGWISDQVGMGVNIPERIDPATVLVRAALLTNNIKDKIDLHF